MINYITPFVAPDNYITCFVAHVAAGFWPRVCLTRLKTISLESHLFASRGFKTTQKKGKLKPRNTLVVHALNAAFVSATVPSAFKCTARGYCVPKDCLQVVSLSCRPCRAGTHIWLRNQKSITNAGPARCALQTLQRGWCGEKTHQRARTLPLPAIDTSWVWNCTPLEIFESLSMRSICLYLSMPLKLARGSLNSTSGE